LTKLTAKSLFIKISKP